MSSKGKNKETQDDENRSPREFVTDGKGGSGINRVNRACNHCRRMKMRCVGAEDPPCKRCRATGEDCVMEKPKRGTSSLDVPGDDRIKHLEFQVSSIQNTLADLVTAIKTTALVNGSPQGTTSGHYSSPVVSSLSRMEDHNRQARAQSVIPRMNAFGPIPSPSQTHAYPLSTRSIPQQQILARPDELVRMDSNYSTHSQVDYRNTFDTSDTRGTLVDPARIVESARHQQQTQTWDHTGFLMPTARSGMGEDWESSTPFRQPQGNLQSNPNATTPRTKRHESRYIHGSSNASPYASEGEEEDALNPGMIMAPLANMSSMAGLAEAAVERARAERIGKSDGVGALKEEGDRKPTPGFPPLPIEMDEERGDSQPKKKRKLSDTSFAVPADPIERAVAARDPPGIILESHRLGNEKKTRKHVHAFPDVAALGLVGEEEARTLFDLYFQGSNAFLPIFDPVYDTWDSLRLRSPFSISAIIAIGARVRDGGGAMSEVQRSTTEHARKIGLGTMWAPVARIEAVQASLVLAAFSQNGWMPSGHAVRLGLDMEINHSFMKLLRSGMGAGKSLEELEDERDLVVQSRCWFALYMIEHQMSYGTGRPAILREDSSIAACRRFLDHPLSIPTDVRLISTVEMIALRAPLHIVLTKSPEEPVTQETVVRLKQANRDFDKWLSYWERVMVERYRKSRTDFFMESLRSQRSYASLFINSQLLRGVKDAADVKKMPPDKKELAIEAMRNAQTCLEIAIRGENYRLGLKYAVHYTHVSAAFAASFLIRIARLFPHELNLRKTAKDVEELASILEQVPAGRYARSLRLLLRRARKSKYLPPPSMPGSPSKMHAQLLHSGRHTMQMSMTGQTPVNATDYATINASPSVRSAGFGGLAGFTPAMQQTSPIANLTAMSGKNESPNSNPESYEFDASFMQDLVSRAGLSFGDEQTLPLFLNGESLGGFGGDANTLVGLEGFFLPPEIDTRFINLNAFNASSTSQLGDTTLDTDLPPDTWW